MSEALWTMKEKEAVLDQIVRGALNTTTVTAIPFVILKCVERVHPGVLEVSLCPPPPLKSRVGHTPHASPSVGTHRVFLFHVH